MNQPGPFSRPHALEALAAEPFDLVVVGGGVTGAGVLLEDGRHDLGAVLTA